MDGEIGWTSRRQRAIQGEAVYDGAFSFRPVSGVHGDISEILCIPRTEDARERKGGQGDGRAERGSREARERVASSALAGFVGQGRSSSDPPPAAGSVRGEVLSSNKRVVYRRHGGNGRGVELKCNAS